MKAIVHKKYDSPHLALKFTDVEKPSPKANEVLVKIKAASINSWDWDLTRGIPRIYRLLFGLFKPKNPIIGIDIAGIVESVGKEVRDLKPGDEVFGDVSDSGFGGFAEYVCTRPQLLAIKPQNASFKQAACLPHGGVLALQSVNYNNGIKSGDKVLINGAGGCTGPIALKMAKAAGAIVTCVDTSYKLDFLKELGGDELIDYKSTDFTKQNDNYDLIIDLVAHHTLSDYAKVLNKNGSLCVVGGAIPRLLEVALLGGVYGLNKQRTFGILAHKPCRENLDELTRLYDKQIIQAYIDTELPLQDVPTAIQMLGEGKPLGKIVIGID